MTVSIFFVFLIFQVHLANGQSGNGLSNIFGTLKDAACGTADSTGFDFMSMSTQDFLNSTIGKDLVSKLGNSQSLQNINGDCLSHMTLLAEAIGRGEMWALKMLDAVGKPDSGLFSMHGYWIGDWDECVNTEAVAYRDPVNKIGPHNAFSGRYCAVTYKLDIASVIKLIGRPVPLTSGLCLPNTCSSSDVEAMLVLVASVLPLNTTKPPKPASVVCRETDYKLDGTAIAISAVCAIFVIVMVIATLYDVLYVNWIAKMPSSQPEEHYKQNGHAAQNGAFVVDTSDPDTKQTHFDVITDTKKEPETTTAAQEYKPDMLSKLLLSFSVYSNGTKLLSTNQPKGSLTVLHGIRFLSMSWVIVGHTFGWYGSLPNVPDNFAQYAGSLLTRFEFQPIMNGTFSVDTFFVLSGLLVAYLSLREMKKRGGARRFKWGLFYFHRFWRLTPPYMLLLMVYVGLTKYFAKGPFWDFDSFEQDGCKTGWWRLPLYINNLVETSNPCFGWAWYLANDMQFYVISPIMLVPLYYSSILGGLSCLALLLVSLISSGLIAQHYDLPMGMMDRPGGDMGHFMNEYYIKPWCRVGPYAIGFFTGYLLYRSELKTRIPRIVNAIGWLLAAALACLVVYGLYVPEIPLTGVDRGVPVEVNYLYTATARSVWAVCVCWLIFSCANGYGGPVNHLLSWPGFVPLGRLTYFAYLVHPIIMTVYLASEITHIHISDLNVVYDCLGHMAMSYGFAFVLSLAFEAPMMGLEKVLLRK